MVVNANEPSKTEPSKLIFNVTVGPEPGDGPGGTGSREWPHPSRLLVAMAPRGLSGGAAARGRPDRARGADGPRSRHRPHETGSHRLRQCPLGDLPARQPRPATARVYEVQALLHANPDLNIPNAPGDLYARPDCRLIRPWRPADFLEAVAIGARGDPPPRHGACQARQDSLEGAERIPRPSIHLVPGDLPRNLREAGSPLPGAGAHRRLWSALHRGQRHDVRGHGIPPRLDGRHAPPMILVHLDGAGPWATPTRSTRPTTGPTARPSQES